MKAVSAARPKRLRPADVVRDLPEEEPFRVADEPGAFLDPVERDQDRLLELPARLFFATPSAPRHRDQVQPLLEPVDVDARVGAAVALDLRVCARALDGADAEDLLEEEVAVADRNWKRSIRRTGGPAVRLPSPSYCPP